MTVRIIQEGPSIEALIESVEDKVAKAERASFGAIKDVWIDIVRDSTWLVPRPSPYSKIVVEQKADGVIEYGWTDYKDGQAASRRRIDQRTPILDEQLTDIVTKAIADAMKG